MSGESPGRERERLVDQFLEPPHSRIDVDRPFRGFRQRLQKGADVAVIVLKELGARPRDAFDQHTHARRRLRHLPDDRDGSDAVQVVSRRLVAVAALQEEQHHPIAGQRAVDGFDRHGPSDAKRRDRHRQDDGFAQRHDRQLRGKRRCLRSGGGDFGISHGSRH